MQIEVVEFPKPEIKVFEIESMSGKRIKVELQDGRFGVSVSRCLCNSAEVSWARISATTVKGFKVFPVRGAIEGWLSHLENPESVYIVAPGVYCKKSQAVIDRNGVARPECECVQTDKGWVLRNEAVCVGDGYALREDCDVCPECENFHRKGDYCHRCYEKDYNGNLYKKRLLCHYNTFRKGLVYILKEEFDRDWFLCSRCSIALLKTEADSDLGVCPDCAEDYKRRPILGYHEHSGVWPLKYYGIPAGNPFVGMGFELEIDGNPQSELEPRGDFNQEFARNLAKSCGLEFNELRFERDGSLREGGFEIISAPHTVKDFWAKQKCWADMLEACVQAGYKSHNARTCGLHVHVSREMFGKSKDAQDVNIGKVYRFYEGAWLELTKASRRVTFDYCDKNRVRSRNGSVTRFKDGTKAWGNRVKRNNRDLYGHHVALNNSNDNTFEYRLGRGTLNKMSFFAWIDLCLTITKNSKKSGKILNESGSWVEWLDGIREQTAKYLLKRNAFKEDVLKLFPQLEWEESDADSAIA